MSCIFVVHHRKGGVGKTTLVQNLAFALARFQNQRVLAIDLDGQANLTRSLDGTESESGTTKLLRDLMNPQKKPIHFPSYTQKIRKSLELFLMPSDASLFNAQDEIANFMGDRAKLLKNALPDALNHFDSIFIDTPPQDGWLVRNALLAAHKILVPVACETFSAEGISNLQNSLDTLSHLTQEIISIYSIIPTMYHGSRSSHRSILELLRKNFQKVISQSLIRTDSNIEKAQGLGKSIFEFSPHSRFVQDISNLALEIL